MRLTESAGEALQAYPWPGNVRELDHVVTRAALRASRNSFDGVVHVREHHLGLRGEGPDPETAASGIEKPPEQIASLKAAVTDFKRRLITETVRNADGNWALAARRLKLHRSNLYRTATKLGLKSPATGGSSPLTS